MLFIPPMPPGSDDYLSSVDYYFDTKGRKRNRAAGDKLSRDGSPGHAPDTESLASGNAQTSLEDTPSEPPGLWVGTGAAFLGLAEDNQQKHYRRILQGFHPITGERLE
jgi:hypothetical protein